MIMGLLCRAVSVDPLDLPAISGEEVMDLDSYVVVVVVVVATIIIGGGSGLFGEKTWVVEEGQWGIGDECCWGQMVLFDFNHDGRGDRA